MNQNLDLSIWTIGHSTRPIDEFVAALQSFRVGALVDVRTYPGSRRYPQFNKPNLAETLAGVEIGYRHAPELGGRRRAKPDSMNVAWRNEMFRGYADHMDSDEFREGIRNLLEVAKESRTAIMCAEAVWWKCHRSLIADHLKAKGVAVVHILGAGRSEEHPFTSAARIVNGELSYRGVLDVSE